MENLARIRKEVSWVESMFSTGKNSKPLNLHFDALSHKIIRDRQEKSEDFIESSLLIGSRFTDLYIGGRTLWSYNIGDCIGKLQLISQKDKENESNDIILLVSTDGFPDIEDDEIFNFYLIESVNDTDLRSHIPLFILCTEDNAKKFAAFGNYMGPGMTSPILQRVFPSDKCQSLTGKEIRKNYRSNDKYCYKI